MKKITLAFVAVLFLGACKKERTCTCTNTTTTTITYMGISQTETGPPSTSVTKYKKASKDAQECISGDATVSGTAVEQGITYTYSGVVKTDCSLQ